MSGLISINNGINPCNGSRMISVKRTRNEEAPDLLLVGPPIKRSRNAESGQFPVKVLRRVGVNEDVSEVKSQFSTDDDSSAASKVFGTWNESLTPDERVRQSMWRVTWESRIKALKRKNLALKSSNKDFVEISESNESSAKSKKRTRSEPSTEGDAEEVLYVVDEVKQRELDVITKGSDPLKLDQYFELLGKESSYLFVETRSNIFDWWSQDGCSSDDEEQETEENMSDYPDEDLLQSDSDVQGRGGYESSEDYALGADGIVDFQPNTPLYPSKNIKHEREYERECKQLKDLLKKEKRRDEQRETEMDEFFDENPFDTSKINPHFQADEPTDSFVDDEDEDDEWDPRIREEECQDFIHAGLQERQKKLGRPMNVDEHFSLLEKLEKKWEKTIEKRKRSSSKRGGMDGLFK